jgi:hypothetical protein
MNELLEAIKRHFDTTPEWAKTIIANQEKFQMATQAQLTKFTADVQALIAAGVAEITAAVAAAQSASPDPAIDALDTQVTTATSNMTAAAAALTPPAA